VEEESAYIVRLGDHIVVANTQAGVEEAIDVSRGRKPSLADNEDFRSLRDGLARNFLGFVYLDPGKLLKDSLFGDPAVADALRRAGADDLALRPAAAVIGGRKGSLEFQQASAGRAGKVSPLLEPGQSRLARLVPGDAAVFFSTRNVAETWTQTVEQARPQLDELIAKDGTYQDLDDALRAAGREAGLESVGDAIDLLAGESAFALWFPEGDADLPEGAFIAEVSDEAAARSVLSSMVASAARGRTRTEQLGNVEITVYDDDGEEAAFAVHDGRVVAGTLGAVRLILGGANGSNLAAQPAYRRALEALSAPTGTFAYVDIAEIVQLARGSAEVELPKATEALSALVVNMVDDGEFARISAVLTVKD
jgi:hypothetical protein